MVFFCLKKQFWKNDLEKNFYKTVKKEKLIIILCNLQYNNN